MSDNQRRHGAIFDVLENRLGKEPSNEFRAWGLVFVAENPTGGFLVWKAAEESARLNDIERAARKLREALGGLPEHLKSVMLKAVDDSDKMCPYPVYAADVIADALAPAITSARQNLNLGTEPGRTNWRNVGFVDQAIFFWNETFSVSGQLAPTRGMDETSNFGRYLIELFEAAELEGNPRSAFDALVRETQRSRLETR
jgi:hypothetical protein